MDTSGIEPEAFSMRMKRDTTTPCTLFKYSIKQINKIHKDQTFFKIKKTLYIYRIYFFDSNKSSNSILSNDCLILF